ncbi:hypothetical protein D3C81_2014700 [compost metagenome]
MESETAGSPVYSGEEMDAAAESYGLSARTSNDTGRAVTLCCCLFFRYSVYAQGLYPSCSRSYCPRQPLHPVPRSCGGHLGAGYLFLDL